MPIKITQLPTLEAPQTYFRDLSPLDAFTVPGVNGLYVKLRDRESAVCLIDGTVECIDGTTAVDRVEMAINWRRQA